MAQRLAIAARAPWFGHAWRTVAAIASAGAALASLISALYSYGIVGRATAHKTIGSLGAAWVGLAPNEDSADAIGDTLHFAATITDRNGSTLVGVEPTWTSDDPHVAAALHDGTVVTRGPGSTMIAVAVGNLVARARVVVAPRVAAVDVRADGGDSLLTVAEDARLMLRAVARDGHDNPLAAAAARWHIDDTTVATVDSAGLVHGARAGRTVVTATVDGIVGHAPLSVVATPAAITAVAGASQEAAAGGMLPQPVVIRVTSGRSRPIEGALVTFRPADGRGATAPDTARTDADGRARTTWTLSTRAGVQRLLASVAHVDSIATITAVAEPTAGEARITPLGVALAGVAGTPLADTIGIRVTDTAGRALGGVAVAWLALDGQVRPLDAHTDSLGEARARWTLGTRPGRQRVRIQVGGADRADAIAPLTLTATATAGAPVDVLVLGGDEQRGTVGAPLAAPITVRVVDRNGNPVPNAALLFTPSAGTVSDPEARTDSAGRARVRWTLGRATGPATLAIHADGVTHLVKIHALSRAAAPANLTFDDAPPSSRKPRRGVERLVALVTDVYGNPVPDARVELSTATGTVSPSRAATDAHGRVAVVWRTTGLAAELTLAGRVRGTDVRGKYIVTAAATAATTRHRR